MPRARRCTFLVLAALGLLGAAILLLATGHGVGLSPDSTVYIGAARNLSEGKGFVALSVNGQFGPVTKFPPMYPALLSLIARLGGRPLAVARGLGAVLFAGNILLIGLFIARYSRGSLLTPVVGSVLMLSSEAMLNVHSMAWSEPLFILLGTLGLFLLARYGETGNRWMLGASSLAICLCFLARYAGLAFVLSGVVGVLFLGRARLWRRVGHAAVFISITCLPMVVWITRNAVVAGDAVGRRAGFYPLTPEQIRVLASAIAGWLVPTGLPNAVRGAGALAVVIIAVGFGILILRGTGRHRKSAQSSRLLPRPLVPVAVFIPAYGLIVLVSVMFIDAYTSLDARMLSPVFPFVLVTTLCADWDSAFSMKARRQARIALAVFMLVLAGSYLVRSGIWISRHHADSPGYASLEWRDSEIIGLIRTLRPDVPVFTNGTDAIYIINGRMTFRVPAKACPNTRQVNSDYPMELEDMLNTMRREDGFLVYLDKCASRWYLPSEQELTESAPLHLLKRGADGAIYKVE